MSEPPLTPLRTLIEEWRLHVAPVVKKKKKARRPPISARDISAGFVELPEGYHLEYIEPPAQIPHIVFKARGPVSELAAFRSFFTPTLSAFVVSFHSERRHSLDHDPFLYKDGKPMNLTVRKYEFYLAARLLLLSATTKHRNTSTRDADHTLLEHDMQQALEELRAEYRRTHPEEDAVFKAKEAAAATAKAAPQTMLGRSSNDASSPRLRGRPKGRQRLGDDEDFALPLPQPRVPHLPRLGIGTKAALHLHANMYIPQEAEELMSNTIRELIVSAGEAIAGDEKAFGGLHQAPNSKQCKHKPGADQIALWFQTLCGQTEFALPFLLRMRQFMTDSVRRIPDPPSDMMEEMTRFLGSLHGWMLTTDCLYTPRAAVKALCELQPVGVLKYLCAVRADVFRTIVQGIPPSKLAVPGSFTIFVRGASGLPISFSAEQAPETQEHGCGRGCGRGRGRGRGCGRGRGRGRGRGCAQLEPLAAAASDDNSDDSSDDGDGSDDSSDDGDGSDDSSDDGDGSDDSSDDGDGSESGREQPSPSSILGFVVDIMHDLGVGASTDDILDKLKTWMMGNDLRPQSNEAATKAINSMRDAILAKISQVKALFKAHSSQPTRFMREVAAIDGKKRAVALPARFCGDPVQKPRNAHRSKSATAAPSPAASTPLPAASTPSPAASAQPPTTATATTTSATTTATTGGPVEVFVVTRSRERKKKKHYTYSNAFKVVRGSCDRFYEGSNIVYEFYGLVYGICDRFNRLLNDKAFKSIHRRDGYLLAADDFYFTALLVDAWVFFITLNKMNISFAHFTKNVAHKLFEELMKQV